VRWRFWKAPLFQLKHRRNFRPDRSVGESPPDG
jgi:hypothetical protein